MYNYTSCEISRTPNVSCHLSGFSPGLPQWAGCSCCRTQTALGPVHAPESWLCPPGYSPAPSQGHPPPTTHQSTSHRPGTGALGIATSVCRPVCNGNNTTVHTHSCMFRKSWSRLQNHCISYVQWTLGKENVYSLNILHCRFNFTDMKHTSQISALAW